MRRTFGATRAAALTLALALPAVAPLAVGSLAVAVIAPARLGAQLVHRSAAFTVTDTSVEQGRFRADARSRDTIVSTYPRAARELHYKFALNGVDNEFPPGIEHTLNLRPRGGRVVTPLHVFGVEPAPARPTPEQAGEGEDGPAAVTIRLDLRHVRAALRARGHYDPPRGPRLRALDRVTVVGDTDPLTWDVTRVRRGAPQDLVDPDGDGVYETTLRVETAYARPLDPTGRAIWARTGGFPGAPVLESPLRLHDALHRLSLEELGQLVRPDGALSAGAKWPGVWTRDVALSGVLALALVAPDALRRSLLAKLDASGRIIQDTGTGGSWPISTDRHTWSLAAWELYAVTGDRAWLRTAHDAIARAADADRHAAFDPATGLVRGESSFLDWREQSYPRWMQPADIAASQASGTNAVHAGAYRALARMARALGGDDARRAPAWDARADSVVAGMRAHLWRPALGRLAPFRYGRIAPSLAPGYEALGEALAALVGAVPVGAAPVRAAPARLPNEARDGGSVTAAVGSWPWVPHGVATLWPYIGGVPYYHNATVWPFVTAYATWAAAEAGHGAAVEHGLATTTRAAALFLTNKENLVAETGHFEGTALNSDRQLWSVAGTLAMTYRVLFGLRPEADRLAFRPMVPPPYAGTWTLRGVRWRGATLDVTMRGHGRLARATLDGAPLAGGALPDTLTGAHRVELVLDGAWPADSIRLLPHRTAPATPVAAVRGARLAWAPVPGAGRYVVHRDGAPVDTVTATTYPVRAGAVLAEWQVAALDAAGLASFLSEPVRVIAPGAARTVKPSGALERAHAGHTGAGYLRLERGRHVVVRLPLRVARAGWYAIDARYANGSGPVNTEDMAAVRTLLVDGDTVGVLVMPQRGVDRWSAWGWTNVHVVRLAEGAHVLTLALTPRDENMNGRVNTALLDMLRLTPVRAPR